MYGMNGLKIMKIFNYLIGCIGIGIFCGSLQIANNISFGMMLIFYCLLTQYIIYGSNNSN